MLDVLVLIAMAVTAAAFAAGLTFQAGLPWLPVLIATSALFLVMAASFLRMGKGGDSGGSAGVAEIQSALEDIDTDLKRLDGIEDRLTNLNLLSERVEQLDQAMSAAPSANLSQGESGGGSFSNEIENVYERIEAIRAEVKEENHNQREKLSSDLGVLESLMKRLADELAIGKPVAAPVQAVAMPSEVAPARDIPSTAPKPFPSFPESSSILPEATIDEKDEEDVFVDAAEETEPEPEPEVAGPSDEDRTGTEAGSATEAEDVLEVELTELETELAVEGSSEDEVDAADKIDVEDKVEPEDEADIEEKVGVEDEVDIEEKVDVGDELNVAEEIDVADEVVLSPADEADKEVGETPEVEFAEPAPLNEDDEAADARMLTIIRDGIEGGRVDLYLQPTVTLPDRKVRYFEAMTRIRTETDEPVLPSDFMPVAKRAALMPLIDNVLLVRSVQVLRRLGPNTDIKGVFGNISMHSVLDSEYFPELIEFLEENNSLSESLVFEISHPELLNLTGTEVGYLDMLGTLGFQFCVDDVADVDADFSVMSDRYFRYVKVSAETFLDVPSRKASDLKRHLDSLSIQLIVEKVEKEDQVAQLLDHDIELAQGHLFDRPRPMNAALSRQLEGAGAP